MKIHLTSATMLVLWGVSSHGHGATSATPAMDRGTIVLDPGHGGSNHGAPARCGGHEKQFTLDLARDVAARLKARGYKVVLTRTSDTYVSLRQRTALANKVRPRALVSLHANASPSHSQRGFETYVLSSKAAHIDVPAMRGTPSPVAAIARDSAIRRSAGLAREIQRSLGRVRSKGDRGVKQASMDVLMGASVPAVLVEVGFIDHAVEGPDLCTKTTRASIASALSAAIDRWSTPRR